MGSSILIIKLLLLGRYVLVFENDFFALRYQNYQLSEFSFLSYRHTQPYLTISEEKFNHIESIAVWMLREFNSIEVNFEKSLRSLLNIMLIDLNRLFEPVNKNAEFSQSLQLIHHFEELIDKYYKEKHFVKDYASLLHVRPNYLNAICNEVTSSSAGDLIRNRILIEAKRLLIHEKKTASEIAYELGFVDNSYFGRFFKNMKIIPQTVSRKSIKKISLLIQERTTIKELHCNKCHSTITLNDLSLQYISDINL